MGIIITGGPGAGKTTLLKSLEKNGYSVVEEKARKVIKEQVNLGSSYVPWKDITTFSKLVMKEILTDRQDGDLVFYDRGIPDILAYLNHANVSYDEKIYLNSLSEMNYHSTVFFLPFWKEIYSTDEERKESKEEAQRISDAIYSTYKNLGFEVITLPKNSVEERMKSIERKIFR